MGTKLIIAPVEKLQGEVNNLVKTFEKIPGIYVSLNKTHEAIARIFVESKIELDRLFFIDCVTQLEKSKDVLFINPRDIELLKLAISDFINEIPGKKYLIVDALSTLLIYNSEQKVAGFVKEITEFASKKEIEVIAFSPRTQGEELLNRIFNFFDIVKR